MPFHQFTSYTILYYCSGPGLVHFLKEQTNDHISDNGAFVRRWPLLLCGTLNFNGRRGLMATRLTDLRGSATAVFGNPLTSVQTHSVGVWGVRTWTLKPPLFA